MRRHFSAVLVILFRNNTFSEERGRDLSANSGHSPYWFCHKSVNFPSVHDGIYNGVYPCFPYSDIKIGTPGVHVSTARESEICYSLGTSVGDVTRLNVANVVRFSLYI